MIVECCLNFSSMWYVIIRFWILIRSSLGQQHIGRPVPVCSKGIRQLRRELIKLHAITKTEVFVLTSPTWRNASQFWSVDVFWKGMWLIYSLIPVELSAPLDLSVDDSCNCMVMSLSNDHKTYYFLLRDWSMIINSYKLKALHIRRLAWMNVLSTNRLACWLHIGCLGSWYLSAVSIIICVSARKIVWKIRCWLDAKTDEFLGEL